MSNPPPSTYRAFCQTLLDAGAEIHPFKDFAYASTQRAVFDFDPPPGVTDGKRVLLRHDVDHDPLVAREMARVETELGIRSTYFLLLSDSGARWKKPPDRDRMLDAAVEMQEAGHEIGMHYDLLGDYFESGAPPRENVEQFLELFRARGLVVEGCASHGSGRMRKLLGVPGHTPYPREYVNYAVWKEIGRPPATLEPRHVVPALDTPCLSLAEFGLRYEAYFLRKDWYFSDSGGIFWGVGTQPPDRGFEEQPEALREPATALRTFMHPGETMQILVHPIWWREALG